MEIDLYKIYNDNHRQILEISEISVVKYDDIVSYFETLNTRELMMYALSYGYQGVRIKNHGCSHTFIKSRVKPDDVINLKTGISNYTNIRLVYKNVMKYTPVATEISYNGLRKLLSETLSMKRVNRYITDMIRDYLVRPEPKCSYGDLE